MLAKIFSYYLKLQKMNTEHQPPHITFFGNSQTKVTGIARIGQIWHPLYVNYRVLLFAVSKKLDKVECFIQNCTVRDYLVLISWLIQLLRYWSWVISCSNFSQQHQSLNCGRQIPRSPAPTAACRCSSDWAAADGRTDGRIPAGHDAIVGWNRSPSGRTMCIDTEKCVTVEMWSVY